MMHQQRIVLFLGAFLLINTPGLQAQQNNETNSANVDIQTDHYAADDALLPLPFDTSQLDAMLCKELKVESIEQYLAQANPTLSNKLSNAGLIILGCACAGMLYTIINDSTMVHLSNAKCLDRELRRLLCYDKESPEIIALKTGAFCGGIVGTVLGICLALCAELSSNVPPVKVQQLVRPVGYVLTTSALVTVLVTLINALVYRQDKIYNKKTNFMDSFKVSVRNQIMLADTALAPYVIPTVVTSTILLILWIVKKRFALSSQHQAITELYQEIRTCATADQHALLRDKILALK